MAIAYLEFRVEIIYEDNKVKAVYIIGKDGFPKVDVLYCMTKNEIEQAEQTAIEALALAIDRDEAIKEDRNRE